MFDRIDPLFINLFTGNEQLFVGRCILNQHVRMQSVLKVDKYLLNCFTNKMEMKIHVMELNQFSSITWIFISILFVKQFNKYSAQQILQQMFKMEMNIYIIELNHSLLIDLLGKSNSLLVGVLGMNRYAANNKSINKLINK